MGFSGQECWNSLPFSVPVGHFLSGLFTMTCSCWLALHSMVHSFMLCDPGREFNEMNMLTTSWLLSCHFKQQLFKTILCTLDNFKFMGRLNNRYRDYPSPTYVYHPLLSTCPTRMTDLSQANVSWFIYHYHPEIMTYIDSSALLYILWAWILSFLMTFLSL